MAKKKIEVTTLKGILVDGGRDDDSTDFVLIVQLEGQPGKRTELVLDFAGEDPEAIDNLIEKLTELRDFLDEEKPED